MTAKQARARTASKLIDRLTALAVANHIPELELRRIDRDARGLMDSDAIGAHIVLGGLAALRERSGEVREHYRIASELSGGSLLVRHNHSVALLRAGEITEALEVARETLEQHPDDADAIIQAVDATLQYASFREARGLCERWNRMFPVPLPISALAERLAVAVERGHFSEEGAREVLHIAQEVRTEESARHAKTSILEDPTEPGSFFYELQILAVSAIAVRINEKIAERIVEREDLMSDPGLRFVPICIGIQPNGDHRSVPA